MGVTFKPGDVVQCEDADGSLGRLSYKFHYIVEQVILGGGVILKEVPGGDWDPARFSPVSREEDMKTKFEVGDVVRFERGEGPLPRDGREWTVAMTETNVNEEQLVRLEEAFGVGWFVARCELVRRAKDAPEQVPSDWEVDDRLEYVGPEGRGLFPRTFYRLKERYLDGIDVKGEVDGRIHNRSPHFFKNLTAAERAAKGALVGQVRYLASEVPGQEERHAAVGQVPPRLLPPEAVQEYLAGQTMRAQRPVTATATKIRCAACGVQVNTLNFQGGGCFDFPLTADGLPNSAKECADEEQNLCPHCAQSVAQHIAYLKTKNDGFDPDVD